MEFVYGSFYGKGPLTGFFTGFFTSVLWDFFPNSWYRCRVLIK